MLNSHLWALPPPNSYTDGVSKHGCVRSDRSRAHITEDTLIEELPVSLEFNGEIAIVMMATPTQLEAFAMGFALTEGIIDHASQMLEINAVPSECGMAVVMSIPPELLARAQSRQRDRATSSSCSLCGLADMKAALEAPHVPPSELHFKPSAVLEAFKDLPEMQIIGKQTGAAHAAAFVNREGEILAIAEDAGRHNALDKLIGIMVERELEPSEGFCAITSRASFEMVQKAARVGFPMLCAISAPTALAVRLAQESGMTLCAFVRGERFTCFAHPQRLEWLTRIHPIDIHAVVLAGGEGRRMGGADKGLAVFHGQVLAQRAAQRLGSTVGRVSISANRNSDQYKALGFDVFSDELKTYEGPLGGVLAALRACTAPYLAVVPCDVPFFPDDLFTYLAIKLSESKARIVMPLVTQPDGGTFPNPVFMLMHVSVLPALEEYFAAGGRKITTWAGRVGLALVPFISPDDSLAFMDADTMQSLADLAQRE